MVFASALQRISRWEPVATEPGSKELGRFWRILVKWSTSRPSTEHSSASTTASKSGRPLGGIVQVDPCRGYARSSWTQYTSGAYCSCSACRAKSGRREGRGGVERGVDRDQRRASLGGRRGSILGELATGACQAGGSPKRDTTNRSRTPPSRTASHRRVPLLRRAGDRPLILRQREPEPPRSPERRKQPAARFGTATTIDLPETTQKEKSRDPRGSRPSRKSRLRLGSEVTSQGRKEHP